MAASQAKHGMPPRGARAEPNHQVGTSRWEQRMAEESGQATVPDGTLFLRKVPTSRPVLAKVHVPHGTLFVSTRGHSQRPKAASRTRRAGGQTRPHRTNQHHTDRPSPKPPPRPPPHPNPLATPGPRQDDDGVEGTVWMAFLAPQGGMALWCTRGTHRPRERRRGYALRQGHVEDLQVPPAAQRPATTWAYNVVHP